MPIDDQINRLLRDPDLLSAAEAASGATRAGAGQGPGGPVATFVSIEADMIDWLSSCPIAGCC